MQLCGLSCRHSSTGPECLIFERFSKPVLQHWKSFRQVISDMIFSICSLCFCSICTNLQYPKDSHRHPALFASFSLSVLSPSKATDSGSRVFLIGRQITFCHLLTSNGTLIIIHYWGKRGKMQLWKLRNFRFFCGAGRKKPTGGRRIVFPRRLRKEKREEKVCADAGVSFQR